MDICWYDVEKVMETYLTQEQKNYLAEKWLGYCQEPKKYANLTQMVWRDLIENVAE